jgi:GDP-L-fucose synthase
MTKNILLIGSEGFLGKNTKKILNKKNNINFFEIENSKTLDILEFEELSNYLGKNEINAVINCAAFVGGISYGYQYQADLLSINSQMAINVYKACYESNVDRLINPISNCAYPAKYAEYEESKFWDGKIHDSVFNYGLSKRLYVALGEAYFQQFNFSSSNIVLSNMYGPLDHFEIERSHALGALILKIYNAKKNNLNFVDVWGTGKPIREWLYVEDGSNALVRALDLDEGHQFFNVGSGIGYSVLEIATMIAKAFDWHGEFKLDKTKPDGVLEKKVNPKLGETILNWSPKTTIDEGINLTVEWFIENEKNITQ